MKLIYIDDSGNTGKKLDDIQQPLFLLGGFIIDEDTWKSVDKQIYDIKTKYDIEELEIHSVFDILNSNIPSSFIYAMLAVFKCIELLNDYYILDKYKEALWQSNNKGIDNYTIHPREKESCKNFVIKEPKAEHIIEWFDMIYKVLKGLK